MSDYLRQQLKVMVRGAYDLQKLRIQTGNRVVANFRAKLGQSPGKSEDELDAAGKALLTDLRQRFDRITDGIVGIPTARKFKGDEVISTYTELCLVASYVRLEDQEEQQFSMLKSSLRDFAVYREFLEGVKGIGPAMAGVIISEIDITRARYPSSLWAYAGLDVARDGRGRSRKAEHLTTYQYTAKDGTEAERNGITFNPFLKTKLVGVLAGSFLKCRSPYRDIYDDYKHRLQSNPAHAEKSDGHRHNMAMRYMVKRFLVDLYTAWRTLEGLPVAPDYHEAKLGHRHNDAA